ncbi:MAG: class I SAM-dependent methyltransferase [Gemmataceae bacterium]
MDHHEVGKYWNENAEAWTELSRAGYDVYRDHLNTPAFLEMLPSVDGLKGLDIGCGEGHNTRLLARLGAKMSAVDVSEVFVQYAQECETEEPLGIAFQIGSAVELPYPDASFDFAASFMCFMDVPETDKVLSEAFRVLKPDAFLQFSIEHPCYNPPHRRNLRDENGKTYALEVGGYFERTDGEVPEWIFGSVPLDERKKYKPFKTPRFRRTVSEWLNLLIQTGFVLEEVREPRADDETVKKCPDLQDTQVAAYFLHIRARKPATNTASRTTVDRRG